jgi:3-methylfumaryl-CoA hydratase
MELDVEQLREWIGRKELNDDVVTRSLAERFNATFDIEEESVEGGVAPLLIHLCLAPPAASTATLGSDGHPKRGGFLPPVPLPRRMWAGGAFTFHDDIKIGDRVSRRSQILDVKIKEGRTGTLCFVTVAHEFHAENRHVITERHDIVYRGLDAAGSPAKEAPNAAVGVHREVVSPSAPLLFRYSALTFNGHRIHYDAPYAREVEMYPGLIVHGPMQATMLAQFATKIAGRRPARFDFRSLSTLFDTAEFTLNAAEDGDALRLWTSYVDGPVAMEARAQWCKAPRSPADNME